MAKRKLTRPTYEARRQTLAAHLFKHAMLFWGYDNTLGPNFVPDIVREAAQAIRRLDQQAFEAGIADTASHELEPAPFRAGPRARALRAKARQRAEATAQRISASKKGKGNHHG